MKAAIITSLFLHAVFFWTAARPTGGLPAGGVVPGVFFAGPAEDAPRLITQLSEGEISERPGFGSPETAAPVIDPEEFLYIPEWSPPPPAVETARIRLPAETAALETGTFSIDCLLDGLEIERLPVEESVNP